MSFAMFCYVLRRGRAKPQPNSKIPNAQDQVLGGLHAQKLILVKQQFYLGFHKENHFFNLFYTFYIVFVYRLYIYICFYMCL